MFNKFNSNSRGNDRGGDRGNRSFGGGDRGGDRSYSRPEMFRTTCATCGNSCEVPFKPANGKPIYCRPCFQNQEDSAPQFAGKSFNSSSFEKFRSDEKQMFATTCSTCGDRCEVPFKPAPGRPIYCRDCMGNKDEGQNDRGSRDDRGARDDRAPMNKAPSLAKTQGPTKDQFDTLNAKLDKVLKILETVMAEVELDAKQDMEDEDFDADFADEDFEDMDEEMFDEVEEVKPAKKAAAKKTAAPKKEVPAKKEVAAKKPTRGQVKRAKRTGKTL